METKACAHCNKDFKWESQKKTYCSRSCAGKAYHLKHGKRRANAARQRRLSDPRYAKNLKLKSNYGLTIDQYEQMVVAQDGRCRICHKETKLHVDHDHSTGLVRALLCNGCNRGLGYFNENIEALKNAAAYLLLSDSR